MASHPPLPPPVPPHHHRVPVRARSEGSATASLIFGLLGFCVPFSGLIAVICGHVALPSIAKSSGARNGKGLAITGLITGYLSIGMWGWLSARLVHEASVKKAELKAASEPFELRKVAIPTFPSLPEFQELEPGGVRVAQVSLGQGNPNAQPGTAMSFRIYLPAGSAEAAPQSLPCVIVAPAGTNLLSGANLDEFDENAYHKETLPYAKAGMVAILYSLDGEDPQDEGPVESVAERMRSAFLSFKAAGAGTVNARNAVEFAITRLPMVDPQRIFSAGHSSAAALSLLVAAHEPRLRGCLAYAPAVELEKHFLELLGTEGSADVLPGINEFVKRSSPLTHAARIRVPVFLFFADDDGMIPAGSYQPFVDALRQTNANVTLQTVPSGGHYQSMIDQGIPAGIEWMRPISDR